MDYFQLTIRIPRPRDPWARFSLRSILLTVVAISLLLGAFHLGKRFGHETEHHLAARRLQESQLTAKVYSVPDLVVSSNGFADFERLITRVTSSVASETWENSGGPCSIMAFPTNFSLVVSQTPDGHQRIADYLGELRAQMPTGEQH